MRAMQSMTPSSCAPHRRSMAERMASSIFQACAQQLVFQQRPQRRPVSADRESNAPTAIAASVGPSHLRLCSLHAIVRRHGFISLKNCLTVKSAEEKTGKPHAFEVATSEQVGAACLRGRQGL